MNNITKDSIYALLEQVSDPEIPVLTILDLGIVRDVLMDANQIEIIITPTYTGCPAMDAIATDIKFKLLEFGLKNIKVSFTLHPAWTTDWMSDSGKEKLKAYGIAPPQRMTGDHFSKRIDNMLFERDHQIECPHCLSTNTALMSQFGSTACKALYQCNDCKEPFDHFKCH